MKSNVQNIFESISDMYKINYCEIRKKVARYKETNIGEYEIEKVDRIITYDNHADYLLRLKNIEEEEKLWEYDIKVQEAEISKPKLKIIKVEYYRKKNLIESYRYEIILPIMNLNTLSHEQELVIETFKKFINLRCAYIPESIAGMCI